MDIFSMIAEKMQDFFEKHGIQPKRENARSYIFDCPACGGSLKLYIEKASGRSICFRHKTEKCPTSKTGLFKTLSLISEIAYEEIRKFFDNKIIVGPDEILEEPIDIAHPEQPQTHTPFKVPLMPISQQQMPPQTVLITDNSAKDGREYLQKRGLAIDRLIKWEISYSIYMRRVVFPVIHGKSWYGWQARTIDQNVEPRMYNLPGSWKGRTLMFYNNLSESEFAIVAEGAVSALKFDNVGGYVATMGKIVSDDQLELLLSSGIKKIYLAMDPDAVSEMCNLVSRVHSQTNGKVPCFLIKVPPKAEDFGDCTYEECQEAFLNATAVDPDCFQLYAYQIERM